MDIINKAAVLINQFLTPNMSNKKVQSWNSIETTYLSIGLKDYLVMLNLAKSIREKGFDKIFFASISLQSLILSKSEYDFNKTPSLCFSVLAEGNLTVSKIGERGSTLLLQLPNCEYCPEIEALLKDLENCPVRRRYF
jgi:hypothetical protein